MSDESQRFQMIEQQPATEQESWDSLLEGAPTANPSTFVIDSDARADWLLRKLADARVRKARAKEWAAQEVERAEAEEARLLARFGPELQAFAEKRISSGKRRSVAFPSGVIGFRAQPSRLEVVDDEKALEWAKTNAPEAVVTIPASARLAKDELHRLFARTGVVPDGATVKDATDLFYIK